MNTILGKYHAQVEATVTDLKQRQVIERIWRKDNTLWKPEPTEITNSLGWLTATDLMLEQGVALRPFAQEIQGDSFRHIVLLGMGGNSFSAGVLGKTFGSAEGYPELIVLDSTLPANVQAVTDTINPAHTLFLVSSKSGITIESICFWHYFKDLVASAIGKGKAG